ncbi:MAG: hypothetical protein LC798_17105 [Chloroflexi bacterium]|nr:hypothetical protein [Chloroflexota bacterium]
MTLVAGIVHADGITLAADSVFDDSEYLGTVESMGGKIVSVELKGEAPMVIGASLAIGRCAARSPIGGGRWTSRRAGRATRPPCSTSWRHCGRM